MKVLSVASARPNFVKLAAVHHALARHADIEHVIVHTGQHYDPLLSDIFFEQLSIPQPDENLEIGFAQMPDRESVIYNTQHAATPVFEGIRPDFVVVYGDVNGAVGGAQAAQQLGICVAHVEAGLRSNDLDMPEEHNRIAIDNISDILFCTEQSGVENLKAEKVKGRIELVGNTMIDTLLRMKSTIEEQQLPENVQHPYAVVTMHRPSNVDTKEALLKNFDFLRRVSQRCPLVWPTHPRLLKSLTKFHLGLPGDISTPPLGYLPFLKLVKNARFILTDSGGIQEEAVLLKKRCFTLRKNTERPITIDCGSNVLIDIDKPEDRQKVLDYAADPMPIDVTIPPLWDGKAGERIADTLLEA